MTDTLPFTIRLRKILPRTSVGEKKKNEKTATLASQSKSDTVDVSLVANLKVILLMYH